MDESPLKRLPGELRNNLYQLLLVSDAPIKIQGGNGNDEDGIGRFLKDQHQFALPLMFTCKQIQKEAAQVFFTKNKFVVSPDSAIAWLVGLLRVFREQSC